MQDYQPRPPARFLLVTRIGKRSLHREWLDGPRNFDVFFSCYDRNLPTIEGAGIHFEYRPGHKLEGYGNFLNDPKTRWRDYNFICLMDEDLLADTETLNRMFRLCEEYQLKIAQPALTLQSHFTFGGLLEQPQWKLRFVNYIEMMCPVFRRDALEVIRPTYTLGYESGIDLVWCNLVYDTERDFAVLDSCPITHTEPVGERKLENGFEGERSYETDIFAVLDRFGIPWFSCTPYAAITSSDKLVTSRLRLVLATFRLLRAVPAQSGVWRRLRPILDHIRHVMFRPAHNVRIDYPADIISASETTNHPSC